MNISNNLSNKLDKISEKKEQKLYRLVSQRENFNKYFENVSIYIPKFMEQVWGNPKSIATILLKSEKNDIKNNMANFIVNNLYSNISSLHMKDEQLIYIVTLLLKEEINTLKTINSNFLYDTCAGILLNEFSKRKEIKFFAKKILLPIFKLLENKYSSENIILDTNKIEKNNKSPIKQINQRRNSIRRGSINENKEAFELFNEKYIYQPINKEILEEKISKIEDKEMIDYLKKIISQCTQSPNCYSNEAFLQNIISSNRFNKIIENYKDSFFQVINVIDLLFENLLNNIDLCPYSIKCFCKIISILIKRKFQSNIKAEQNNILIKFFFESIIVPFLMNPLNSFINEIIISESSMGKIGIIVQIINKLLKGKLYEKNSYTPFNWYIIEKMPKVFEFLNKICQVSLPSFIDKLLNDELPENYEYDYFKENPNEKILFRNICFNIDELYCFIKNAEKCKDEISIDKVTLSKFQINMKKIETLKKTKTIESIIDKNGIEFETIDEKKIIQYFLLTDLINNKNLDKLLKIKKHKKKKIFSLKELEKIETPEQRIENIRIKVKNLFCALLYNYQSLSKNEFKVENLSNILNILKELKTHSYLTSFVYMDDKIPIEWYINSLIHYLPNLPSSYRENDYEKLLNEIKYDILNSIKEFDFEKLTIFIDYYKEAEKERLFYIKIKNIINDLDLNKTTQSIIHEGTICLDLNLNNKITSFFKNILKEKEFSNLFQIKNDEKDKKKYNTINSFINEFPNMEIYQLDEGEYFEIMEKKKIPEIINNYCKLIRNDLKRKNFENDKNYEEINNKIYDYITEQLYDKLFPKDQLMEDIKVFQNCVKHIWVEYSNLINKNNNYIFDDYLPDSINYFKQFEKEKSPRKKLLCLQAIFNCIYNLAIFNGDELEGADDEIPLLNYTLIQSKPERMYSNSKYTELFLGDKASGREGSQLFKIIGICEKMTKVSFQDFYNLTESDYIHKNDLAIKGFIY